MQKEERKPKKRDNGLLLVLIGLLVIGAIAGLIYMDTFYGTGRIRGYFTKIMQGASDQAAETVVANSQMELDDGSRSTFVAFGNSFVLCTRDGVKYFNEMGDRRWNDTFNMTAPSAVYEGNYIAVGDIGGKNVRVYNENGAVYAVQTEGTLMQFALNENGYLSVITKENSAYRIQIFNASGTLLKERVEESEGVYPLCSDVSTDNRAFVISYMDTSDIEPIGKVLFFYINPQDSEEYTDSMYAAVEKSNEIIPVVGYMEGNILAAVSDRAVYGISPQGLEAWNYPLGNMIQQVSLAYKGNVVLAMGDAFADREGLPEGTVCWLNNAGKATATYQSGEEVTYLHASNQGVVIGNDKDYTGLRHSGSAVWSYRATADIQDMLPMERLDQVLVVTKSQAMILQLRGSTSAAPAVADTGDTEPEVVGGTTDESGNTTQDVPQTTQPDNDTDTDTDKDKNAGQQPEGDGE